MKSCALLLSLLIVLFGGPAWAEGELVTGPDRRHEIDLRIEALDARRAEISTTGPAAATIIGLVTTAVGGIMLGATAPACSNRDQEGCASFGAVMAGGAITGIGLVTTLVAAPIWGVRVHRRNEIDAERESLLEERNRLKDALSRLELQSPHRNDTQFVTLGVRF